MLVALLVITAMSCSPTGFRDTDETAIRQVMRAQEKAWDSGDIPAFMEGYARDACFISARGRTCGRDSVTAKYLAHYPDRSAMGDLQFNDLEVVPAGSEHAWVTGQWHLYRSKDTLQGGFSLLWVRGPGGWCILRDHTY